MTPITTLLATLADLDDGTGTLGTIASQALLDDPSVTAEAVRAIVLEALEYAAEEYA